MDEQTPRNIPQSRVKKGTYKYKFVFLAAALIILGSYFYLQKGLPTFSSNQEKITTTGESELTNPAVSHSGNSDQDNLDMRSEQETQLQERFTSSNFSENDSIIAEVQMSALTSGMDVSSLIEQRLSSGGNHLRLTDEINSFYTHLDQQTYIEDLALTEPSQVYFSELLQKVADNPPVVHGETNDLFTLLQNTAHFFRILGKDNIDILKRVLEQEKNSFEHVVKSFYGLTYQPESLKEKYKISIPPATLTDYAAFFLNTMGGRLYLYRLDPTSRMVVTYYAIITIDRANSEGRGGHGIDIRPFISSLTYEMENGGGNLQLKDEYLDVLYDLQEKYNVKGS
ncbi:MAG: hypothetical protein WBB23_18285 [Desulforhopalus sp.]